MTMTERKEKIRNFMQGNLTMTGMNFFLVTAIMLLAGICIGLLTAPFTHGINIGSNNGNSSGCSFYGDDEDCSKDSESVPDQEQEC